MKKGKDPEWFTNYVEGNAQPTGVHSSEYVWARSEFDIVIENDGSLQDLYNKVDDLIVSNKITHSPSKPSGTAEPLAIGTNSF